MFKRGEEVGKIYIIASKDGQISDGPGIYSYEGLFFTDEDTANKVLSFIPYSDGLCVKELNLYEEHLV